MHYSLLINIGCRQNKSTDNNNVTQIGNVVNDSNIPDEMYSRLDTVIKLIESTTTKAPECVENTTLNDTEISEVMCTLLDYQKRYFPEIPLSKELQKTFVWNLPREIYDTHKHVTEYGYPDILNPLMLFYIYCTDGVINNYGKFLHLLTNLIKKDWDEILTLSEEFDNYESDETEDSEQ